MYWDDLQAMVDDQFENASNIYTIQKMNNTTGLYEEIIVRLDTPYELKLKTSVSNDFRKVIFKDSSVSTLIGDIYKFNDSYWICTDGGTIESPTSSCIIERCNNTLQFYDSSSTLHSIPCIISKGLISLDEQKIISTLDSEIAIQISNTSITRQIPMNYIFKLGLRNYSVTDINDITVNGLLLIKMVYSEVEQVFPSYSLTILNGDSIQADINTPVQLNIQVKDREIIITSPLLTFTSSNNLIATVSSTGLVNFLSVGSVMINCKLDNDNLIQDSIGIEIVDLPQDNFTYTLVGNILPDTEIKSGSTKIYTAHKFNNGIEIMDAIFDFSIIAGTTPSSAYVFSVLSGNSCSIKCNSYTYYVTLRGTDVGNGEIVEKVIKLRSIM